MASNAVIQLAFKTFEPDDCETDKPPIIFVHGVCSSKETWCDIPETIAKATHRKVYSIDSRNHGESPLVEDLSFDDQAIDLLNFMDTIAAPKVILVGHSMGGITVMRVALKAPEKVEKLIVEDLCFTEAPLNVLEGIYLKIVDIELDATALEYWNSVCDRSTESIIMEIRHRQRAEENIILFNFFTVLTEALIKKSEHERRTRARPSRPLQTNICLLLQAMVKSKAQVLVSTEVYEGPSCFINGSKSFFKTLIELGVLRDNIKKYFLNAEIKEIDEASHCVHTDHPHEFTEALLNFLQA